MAPLYRKALIIGATSGIGEAFAAKLHSEGTAVIVTGRRRDRLDAFVASHPRSSAAVIDIVQLDSIPAFAASVIQEHPDLDLLVLNAAVMRPVDFARPESVDLSSFDEEFTTNYVAFVHLATAFLAHFQRRSREGKGGHLFFVNSAMALVPTLVRASGYNASKAALHSWVLNLRQQLKDAGYSGIKVVEVFPPAVQTENMRKSHMVNGGEVGMPLDVFTELMYEGLVRGDEQFAMGAEQEWITNGFEAERVRLFQEGHLRVKQALEKSIKN
ncbi:putative short-chain dehydrogenase/oxidoreductase [Hypoxylon sp. EC38]|nr:putative short-chain dehydrogenase/oxidoreductase [Hypoxylon sp. EC38]